jgi:hypothetical protein
LTPDLELRKRRLQALNTIISGLQNGVVDPEELHTAVMMPRLTRKSIALPAPDAAVDDLVRQGKVPAADRERARAQLGSNTANGLTDSVRALELISKAVPSRLGAMADAQTAGFFEGTTKSFLQYLERTGIGAGALIGQGVDYSANAVKSVFGAGRPAYEVKAAIAEKHARAAAMVKENFEGKVLGLPTDPLQRAVYDAHLPMSARVGSFTGDLVGLASVAGVTGKLPMALLARATALPGVGVKAAQLGMLLGAAGNRVNRFSKLGTALGIGVPAATGASYLMFAAHEDDDAMERLEYVLAGMAGASMLMSALFGRPYGPVARQILVQESSARGFWGKGVRVLGNALAHSPRLTLGNMAASAIGGAAITTAEAAANGVDARTAILEGAKQGLVWAGSDIATARIGNLARWGSVMTNAEKHLLEKAWQAGVVPGPQQLGKGRLMQAGVNAAVGAAAGGGIAQLTDQDVTAGVMAGAVGGVVGLKLFQSMRTSLPRGLVNKVVAGEFGALTADEAGEFASFLVRAATKKAALETGNTVVEMVTREALGTTPLDPRQAATTRLLNETYVRMLGGNPAQAFISDVTGNVLNDAMRTFEAREKVAQLVRERALPLREAAGNLSTQAAEHTLRTKRVDNAAMSALSSEVRSFQNLVDNVGSLTQAQRREYGGRAANLLAELTPQTAESVSKKLGKLRQDFDVVDKELRRGAEKGTMLEREFEHEVARRTMDMPYGETVTRRLADDDAREWLRTMLGGAQRDVEKAQKALVPEARRATGGGKTAAAVLPNSIDPQAAHKVPLVLAEVRNFVERHGMKLRMESKAGGGYRFIASVKRGNAAGVEVARGENLRGLLDDIAKKSEELSGQRLSFSGEAGKTRIAPLGASGGAALGAAMGPLAANIVAGYLNDDPDEKFGGAVYAALAGGLIGATIFGGAGKLLEKYGKDPVAKFFKVPDVEELPDALAKQIIGKPKIAIPRAAMHGPRTQPMRAGSPGRGPGHTIPERQLFLRLPQWAQVEHLSKRMTAVVGKVNLSTEERYKLLHDTIRKYAPSYLVGNDVDKLRTEIYMHMRTVAPDMAPARAEGHFRGLLALVQMPYERRVLRTDKALQQYAHGLYGPIGEAKTIKELRDAVDEADIITGPSLLNHRKTTEFLGLAPAAEKFKRIMAVEAGKDFMARGNALEAGVAGRLFGIIGSITPTEHYRTVGRRLIAEGKTAGTDILDFYEAMSGTTERVRTEFESSFQRLNNIFKDIDFDERLQVRHAMESPTIFANASPRVQKAAIEARDLVDEFARKAGLDPGNAVENYYPWLYSIETIKELKASGRVPTEIFIPIGSHLPEHKILQRFLSRGNEALGDVIEDPLEALTIYLNGAVRKTNMDGLIAKYDGAWFERLANAEPLIASDLATWMMDVYGIPNRQYVAWSQKLHAAGVKLDRIGDYFSKNDFLAATYHRYLEPTANALQEQDALSNFTKFVRGFEFYSKMGFQFTSALVNLGQLITNAGTDVGMHDLFIGGISFNARHAQGMIAERIPRLASFIDSKGAGAAKVKLARRVGVFSDASRRVFEDIVIRQAKESSARTISTIGGASLVGAGTGAFAGAYIGDDQSVWQEASAGAAFAGATAAIAPALVRRALHFGAATALFPFASAEAINRGMTAGGALRQVRNVMDAKNIGRTGNPVGHALESIALGATAGALVGSQYAEEGEGLEQAGYGALVGGVVGGAIKGENKYARVMREISFMEKHGPKIPGFSDRLGQSLNAVTPQEIERWYVRQVLDMTQFRFGREARGRALNTPMGEVMGALQTFTLNQMEFVGSRWDAYKSSGMKDMRIWRHLALLTATGAAYTNVSMMLGNEDVSPYYWLSRLGLGMMPILRWNDDARTWAVSDVGAHLTGPFISDVVSAFNFIKTLATDPFSYESFSRNGDKLARDVISAWKQVESLPTQTSNLFQTLHAEGTADLLMQQQDVATRLAHPVSMVLGQEPNVRGGGGSNPMGGGMSRGGMGGGLSRGGM